MDKVYVDVIKYNPRNGMEASVISKSFADKGEFSIFYESLKADSNCVVNVRFYNPKEDPETTNYFENALMSPKLRQYFGRT